jgi:acetyl esterase/lipase
LDIYFPTRLVYAKSPVVLYLHGGAWITGRKEAININRLNSAINTLRDLGYTIVAPSYTLAKRNKSPFPDCISDAFDALNWIEAHAGRYNFDAGNVGILGESAGAHIAMMTAFAGAEEFAPSPGSTKIRYVIDIYGPVDLERLYGSQTLDSVSTVLERLPDKISERLDFRELIFGFDPEEDSVRRINFLKTYSPIFYIKGGDLPVLIIHGSNDRIVPIEQSLLLQQKLDSLQMEYEIHVLDSVGHAFTGVSKEQKMQVQDWIVNFIKNYFHRSSELK